MEINGKVHCFFEQSGTFKNEFIKLGIPAEDYDIQNNFGETDHIVDLFKEIEAAYDGKESLFDGIREDDLIIAFFPCIYFECMSMMYFNWCCTNYKKLSDYEKTRKIIEREKERTKFYTILLKLVAIVMNNNIRLIIENPYALQHYLKQGNFVKKPDLIDKDRSRRGDFFIKPTAYWFFNCKPTYGFTRQQTDKKNIKNIIGGKQLGGCAKGSKVKGICSEERSMISPDYARNFICNNILGVEQFNIDIQYKMF